MATQDSKFRSTINLPIAIPAWGLVTLVAGAVFTSGVMFNKMDTLIESVKDSKEQLAALKEKQMSGMTAIATLQIQQQNHETRITNLERIVFERKAQ